MIFSQVTLYQVLGVKQDAPEDVITKTYRKLSRHVHPDKTKSATTNLQVLVNYAYETLSDQGKRMKYDLQLQAQGRGNNGRNENNVETELLRRQLRESQHREAQMQRQLKQTQQQVRQSEEMLRQRNMKLSKERRQSQQQLRRKDEELQRLENEKIARLRCGICSFVVDSSNFWASGCCGKLFCEECLIKCGEIVFCQYIGCKQPIRKFPGSNTPAGWTQNDPFTKTLIEDTAQVCNGCRKYIPKPDFESHILLCPALNQSCYKCNGTGKLQGPFKILAACNACGGKGILRGDWTRCFACLDETQSSDLSSFCQMCFGNKCFQGKWSPCFRCDCKGIVTQITEIAKDYCPTKDESRNETIILHSITAMSKYADKSFEELRLESYTTARHPTERLVTCEVCEGKKKLKGDWVKCTATSCNFGRVRMFNGAVIHCIICDGKGSVSVENGSVDLHLRNGNTKPCPFCLARGCGNCGGSAHIAA